MNPRISLESKFAKPRRIALAMTLAAGMGLAAPPTVSAQKAKLPPARVLERGVRLERDPATGELRAHPATTSPGAPRPQQASSAGVIRARVALVEVGCTVVAPDGTQVRGLRRDDFRVLEDGVEQNATSFDAATAPASIALLLDDSPSIYRELGETREAARSLARSLGAEDEVAVVAFADQTRLLLPFSRDRDLLAAALSSPELARVANASQSFVYQAVYLTAHELFFDRSGRKAMVLLTDGQDSGLGLTWDPASMHARPGTASPLAFDDVARELASRGIALYVISTEGRPRAMTEAWLAERRREPLITPDARKLGMPQYTLYLAEMERQAGGGLYFLREIGGLAEVYRRIALALGAEYTLGYYPAAGAARPGWRELRVELRSGAGAPPGSQVAHRASYYVSAAP